MDDKNYFFFSNNLRAKLATIKYLTYTATSLFEDFLS